MGSFWQTTQRTSLEICPRPCLKLGIVEDFIRFHGQCNACQQHKDQAQQMFHDPAPPRALARAARSSSCDCSVAIGPT